jgi:hypothetical protein
LKISVTPKPGLEYVENAVKAPLPFIPSAFDDYGFTPAQFRVVCRIARRGNCFESIPNIAVGCKLAINTVKKVIPELISLGVLEKQSRSGETSILKLSPIERWRDRSKDTPGIKRPVTRSKPQPDHPAQKTTYKGIPPEGKSTKDMHPSGSYSFIPT